MIILDKKSTNFLYIEECIKDIQNGGDEKKNIEAIKRALNREMHGVVTCMEIYVTKSNILSKFFGMRVFPTKERVTELVNHIRLPKNNSPFLINNYIIEIDGRLLYDKSLKMTSGEIVAMLLHEVGHIVCTDRVYTETRSVILTAMTKYGVSMLSLSKFLVSANPVSFLLELVVIQVCTNYSLHLISQKSEMDADKYVINKGYGEELRSVFMKFIKTGQNHILYRNKDEFKENNNTIADWSVDNLINYDTRLNKISQYLKVQYDNNESIYLKLYLKDKVNKLEDLVKNIIDRMKLSENLEKIHVRTDNEILSEFFNFISRFPEKITKKDVDDVRIEMQRIEDIDDKLYVMEMIMIRKDKVQMAINYLTENPNNPKKYKIPDLETLKSYFQDLCGLQDQVVQMRIPEKTYGVFIKYPTGYEG